MRKTKANDAPQTTAQSLGSLIKSCRDIMRKDKGISTDIDRLPMLTWIMFLKFLDDMEQVRETEAKLEGKRFRPAIEEPYRWRDWADKPDGITGDALREPSRVAGSIGTWAGLRLYADSTGSCVSLDEPCSPLASRFSIDFCGHFSTQMLHWVHFA